jgi:hypothetical protein
MLSREEILGAADIRTEEVEVRAWGGTVRVQTVAAAVRDAIEMATRGADVADVNVRARWLAASCVDADGRPLFRPEDIPALGRKSSEAVDLVFAAVARVNGLGVAQVDAAKNA